MGSHFVPAECDTNTVPSCYPYYTHNPYVNNTDFSEVHEVTPCQCPECLATAYGQFPPEPVYDYEYYGYHDVSPGHQSYDEEVQPELQNVPTVECDVLDPIDRPAKYIFIGQLPFQISDDKVNWLVREFGRATRVFGIEAIWKPNNQTGEMQHKGCVHVLIPRDEVIRVVRNLHHHVLMHHDTVLYGETPVVEYWAGRVFPTNARVASNALVCESSARQVPRK